MTIYLNACSATEIKLALPTTPQGCFGASDGIRTRVYGFAGRCLAAQPHPHEHLPCQLGPPRPSICLALIVWGKRWDFMPYLPRVSAPSLVIVRRAHTPVAGGHIAECRLTSARAWAGAPPSLPPPRLFRSLLRTRD